VQPKAERYEDMSQNHMILSSWSRSIRRYVSEAQVIPCLESAHGLKNVPGVISAHLSVLPVAFITVLRLTKPQNTVAIPLVSCHQIES
jgi:hypothetical protein